MNSPINPLLKLLIVCFTIIISILIISYSYYESNRYVIPNEPNSYNSALGKFHVIDKYNATIRETTTLSE